MIRRRRNLPFQKEKEKLVKLQHRNCELLSIRNSSNCKLQRRNCVDYSIMLNMQIWREKSKLFCRHLSNLQHQGKNLVKLSACCDLLICCCEWNPQNWQNLNPGGAVFGEIFLFLTIVCRLASNLRCTLANPVRNCPKI